MLGIKNNMAVKARISKLLDFIICMIISCVLKDFKVGISKDVYIQFLKGFRDSTKL